MKKNKSLPAKTLKFRLQTTHRSSGEVTILPYASRFSLEILMFYLGIKSWIGS